MPDHHTTPDGPSNNALIGQVNSMARRAGFFGGHKSVKKLSKEKLNALRFSVSIMLARIDEAEEPPIKAGATVVPRNACVFGNFPTNRNPTLTSEKTFIVSRVWYCDDRCWRLEFKGIVCKDGTLALYRATDFREIKG